MTKRKIKTGDKVIVIAGRDKGAEGEVTKILPAAGRAIVSGINRVKKHQKPSQTSNGGIIERELSINISNLAIKDPKTGKASRIGYKFLDNGEKVRISKRSGEVL